MASTAPTSTTRLFTPAFIALSLAELAYFTAAGLTIPVTPLFAHGPLGATEVGVGLAVGSFSLTALILRPYAGRLSDRAGRRPLLVGGALGFAVVLALHAVVDSLPLLIGLRLLLGVAEAFFFVAGFAAVADLAPPGRAGEALSFNSLSLYLGVAFGPLVGQLLLETGGFAMAWLGGAALAVVAAGLAWRIPETASPTTGDAGPTPFFNRAALAPSVALFTGIVGMGGFFAFVAIHAIENLGAADVSGVLFLFGLIVVVIRVVFARLPDRVPPFRLGSVALTLIAGGLIVASLATNMTGIVSRSCRHRRRRRVPDARLLRRGVRPRRAVGAGLGVGDGEPVHRPRVRRRTHAAGAGRRVARDPRGVRGRGVDRRAGRDRIGRPRAPRCAEPAVGGAAGALRTVR